MHIGASATAGGGISHPLERLSQPVKSPSSVGQALAPPSAGTPGEAQSRDGDRLGRNADRPESRPPGLRPGRSHVGWMRRYQFVVIGIDLLTAAIAGQAAYAVRFGASDWHAYPSQLVAVAMPFGWVAVVAANRGYETR